MTTRRDFVRTTAAALGALTLPGTDPRTHLLTHPPANPDRIERIGVQLYTVRGEMEKDFDGTLGKVAEIGFKEVEFAGYFGRTPGQVHNRLLDLGLVSPSAHLPYESLGDGWQAVLDDAQEIGQEYVLIAWTPVEARQTLDDWKRIAEKFNQAGEAARSAGLGLAYHNHDFEFKPIGGQVPFDLLLAQTDPALVKIEMDLYWITIAGGDPFRYFARYPGRFPMVHVKDLKRGAEHPMVDVGAGDIDWKAIFARHEQAGIQHYFVEHDEPADPFASIRASYEYLKRLEF